jgi:hypothetical protein
MNLILILLVIPESLDEAGQRDAQNGDSPVVLNKPTLKKRRWLCLRQGNA